MPGEKIKLVELSDSEYGVLVARMLPAYVTQQVEEDITTPHRHDYYSLLLVETGIFDLKIDFQSETLQAPSILLLKPGQVHQTLSSNNVSGWIMLFDGQVIDQQARFAIDRSFQNTILFSLESEEVSKLGHLFGLLLENINEKHCGIFHKQFLYGLLNGFLYKAVDLLYQKEAGKLARHPTRAVEISRNFNQLVKANFRTLKKPSDYADKMHITVSYLNDTLKSVTGFPCSYMIHQEVIGEAKRLLYYTSKSVKEIAVELGYRDYKYFIRQFGKMVNSSPAEFRKMALSMH
jgi:AraC family transcriptional regulator, transcriptional activator of pobA